LPQAQGQRAANWDPSLPISWPASADWWQNYHERALEALDFACTQRQLRPGPPPRHGYFKRMPSLRQAGCGHYYPRFGRQPFQPIAVGNEALIAASQLCVQD